MILEGIVTSVNADESINVSPMGPLVDTGMTALVLRPYQTSTTYGNLKRTGQGVFHVTDDVELLARAAVGRLDPPPLVAAQSVACPRLADCCRWYEFRVSQLDDRQPRTHIECEVIATGRVRDFFGFNRGKHAVVEAAILATRVGILPDEQIIRDLQHLAPWVEKTGGEAERRAFAFLQEYISNSLSMLKPDQR